MSRHRTPLQKIREADQIARSHGMHVIECRPRNKPGATSTEFVLYRDLPDGRSIHLGARSSIDGIRALVVRAAEAN